MRRRGLKPDCNKCGKVDLLAENNIINYLMDRYSGLLVNKGGELSNGSINAEGLRLVLDIEEIENKQEVVQKLVVYLSVAQNTQQREKMNE